MSDLFSTPLDNLAAALAARPAAASVGWRAGALVTTADFLARAGAWHALLRAQAGANFALYLEDSIDFGAALLGAWHAGKTIWLGADTLDATCAALRGSVDGFLGQYPAALAPLQPDQSNHAHEGALPAGALDVDAPALVVFTSGSTGEPQAIPKKLSQIASEVATLDELFGATAGDAAVVATVSHQHIYGLLFKVLWPLTTGRMVHALSLGFHEELAPALAFGACVLVASPAHLKRLPEHLDWSGAARNLRAVFSSGGPLAPDTALATGALLGKVPVEVYGSSETGGVAWRQRAHLDDDAWRAFPTVAWRLGKDGALEVRSPHLPDDSWLVLADRAAPAGDAADAGFVLRGRSDRIVKIEEKRVSLTAMEAALLASGLAAEARVIVCEPAAATPAVHAASATSVTPATPVTSAALAGAQAVVAPTGDRQRIAAFVVPTAAGAELLAREGKVALNNRLRAALAATVAAVALPRRWRYLDRMPVNAQGKTTLAALEALLDAAPAPVTAPQPVPRPIFPHVRELERDEHRVLLEVTAPADLLYFDGHFDVAPILPGVVQVEWALHYGRQYFTLPPNFTGVNLLKFQQVVRPDMAVQLELVHDTAKGSLNFRYVSEGSQHSSGRIMLAGEQDNA
ncbi:AMP-binding protein [Duganella sp. FT27W]|uniref:AMP-binding protein n=1 Tax=Duganella sp. FT27W TaxID=2654636 RepID=UPI00128B42E4|nr:AMP-binding protein [Duganella sp. FT27W]MPQ56720.1 AMP-binding protein [Duganella sp. FT27W]